MLDPLLPLSARRPHFLVVATRMTKWTEVDRLFSRALLAGYCVNNAASNSILFSRLGRVSRPGWVDSYPGVPCLPGADTDGNDPS